MFVEGKNAEQENIWCEIKNINNKTRLTLTVENLEVFSLSKSKTASFIRSMGNINLVGELISFKSPENIPVTTSRALAVTSFKPPDPLVDPLTVPFHLFRQLVSVIWANTSLPSMANLLSSLPHPSISRESFRTRILFISRWMGIFLPLLANCPPS